MHCLVTYLIDNSFVYSGLGSIVDRCDDDESGLKKFLVSVCPSIRCVRKNFLDDHIKIYVSTYDTGLQLRLNWDSTVIISYNMNTFKIIIFIKSSISPLAG